MSGIQLTKALSRPEIWWVWQDVSPSDPLLSQYSLTGGRDRRTGRSVLLAQVWWKSEPPQLGPPLGLLWTRLVMDAASWQTNCWEVMPVVPYPSAYCMETAYQVIPEDTYYHIILNVCATGYSLQVLQKIKDRFNRMRQNGWVKANTVNLTVGVFSTSGSCLSWWGKGGQERQINSYKEKQNSFVCHPLPQYFVYLLNQTRWNDKAFFHTAWSCPWNKIHATNHGLQYISQDILLQTFTAHWLWFNFLNMVQCIEVRPISGRGIMNMSACHWTPTANKNRMKLSDVITPLITTKRCKQFGTESSKTKCQADKNDERNTLCFSL